MKLSELYTTGSVAKKFSSTSVIAGVYTRTFDELFPDINTEFDTTVLFNNGSTSEMLNNGAYGSNFTAYNLDNTLHNGEPTKKIEFLGCAIVENLQSELTAINLSRKITTQNVDYGYDWNSIKDCRFIINVVSSENIDYTDYVLFDVSETSNIVYNFNTTYVMPYFYYKETNEQSEDSGYVHNPETLIGQGADGNNGNRICSASFSVYTSEYNKYMPDTKEIQRTYIGKLVFAYKINGEYFLVNSPLNSPDYGYKHFCFTENAVNEYLTIGGFGDFEDGINGFLPKDDETKGAFAFETYSSHSYRKNSNYFVTANCAIYTVNSCGLRWILSDVLTTAKAFRENVRLGVMDKNGIVNHKEWIVGEPAIQSSDNPNKDTSYDNIPNRPSSSGGDDIDEIGINDFPFNYVGGLARYYAIDRFQLDELISDFKKSEQGIPLDAGQFVIGLYQLPLDIPSLCTTSQEKIVLGKLETNAVGKKLLTVNRKIHLGEYFISANCGNNFLDYAPYTEIKLYVPFCGIVELPPNLFINSTVSVDMIIDIISGSCKGIVMCNNTFYTSVNGSLMCSLPLSLEQCATKSLSIINSANSIISGIIFGNKNYSALNGVTTLGEAMIENNNIAPSHISGNMDSVVNFYNPQCCILFMTYPEVNMGDIGKTHGKVCNYQDTLKNCHGYTVVNNPHLEIKCTNTEKDEITKLLEQGVILP